MPTSSANNDDLATTQLGSFSWWRWGTSSPSCGSDGASLSHGHGSSPFVELTTAVFFVGSTVVCCGLSVWAGYRLRPRLTQLRQDRWHARERRLRNPTWLLPSFTLAQANVQRGPASLLSLPFVSCRSHGGPAPATPSQWVVSWWAAVLGPRYAPNACRSNLLSTFLGGKLTATCGDAAAPATPTPAGLDDRTVQSIAAVPKRSRGRPRKRAALGETASPSPSSPSRSPPSGPMPATTMKAITVKKRRVLVAATAPSASASASARTIADMPLLPCELPLSRTAPALDGTTTPWQVSPNTIYVLQKQTFTTLYHPSTRTALWGSLFLTAAQARRAARQHRLLTFFSDPVLPRWARGTPAQCKKRGYDRGHLAPHAAVAVSERAALEAAMLTNVALQDSFVNRRVWRKLEALPRAYVKEHADTLSRRARGWLGMGHGQPQGQSVASGDAALLARLFDCQAALEGTPPPHGLPWCGRQRQLAVCTGPLFSRAHAPSRRGGGGAAAPASASTKHKTHKKQKRAARMGREGKAAAAPQSPAPASPLIPSSFFMLLWDPDTHAHVAFIVPNHPDRAMKEWEAVVAAAAAATTGLRSKAATPTAAKGDPTKARVAHGTRRQATRTRKAAMARDTGDDGRWLQLLRRYVVPLPDLEERFARSLVAIAETAAATGSGTGYSGPGSAMRSSPPTSPIQAHIMPVYQRRWQLWMGLRQRRQRVLGWRLSHPPAPQTSTKAACTLHGKEEGGKTRESVAASHAA